MAAIARRSTAPGSRVSASPYDVLGNSKTIAFGGWGRTTTACSTTTCWTNASGSSMPCACSGSRSTGAPRDGNQTIKWDNAYLSRTALDGLIASGVAPNPRSS